MVNKKLAQFSCEHMGGYRVMVDIDTYESLDTIVDYCVTQLKLFLKNNNLEQLYDIMIKKTFHIHGDEYGNIVMRDLAPINIDNDNDTEKSEVMRYHPTFYVCDHC